MSLELAISVGCIGVGKERTVTISVSAEHVSIEELFDNHAKELLGYIRALLGHQDMAEDALQETFIRLAGRVDKLTQVVNLRGYLFRIARNEALRIAGREKRRCERHEAIALSPLIEPAPDAIERREEIECLEQALRRLPDKQREIVFLKCVEGFTFAEIAQLLGIPQNTAASRYRYGIEKLRESMEAKS